jgi:signal transduction histidine kinase
MVASGAIWLMLALISTGQMMISQQGWISGRPVYVILSLNVPTYAFWWLVTPLLFHLANRFRLDSGGRVAALVVHVAAALGLALVPSAASTWFMRMLDPGLMPGAGRNLLGLRYGFDIITYVAVIGVATGIRLWDASREGELRAARLQSALVSSRLEALSLQMQPHFLYNALNSVAMLIRAREYQKALDAVIGYASLMRAVLNQDAGDLPLRDEIAFINRYLELELLRFPDSFTASVDIGPEAAGALVPRMLLLPLVENALHHGFTGEETAAHLGIVATARNGRLKVTVWDNGQGMPPGWSASNTSGLGLANTRRRLLACYGEDQALEFESGVGVGTTVHVRMPWRHSAVA